MKWSKLSDKEKVELILKHVLPHDMGVHIVFEQGEFHIPRGGDVRRRWNYPVAAWDELTACWQTREGLGSNWNMSFDPLHDMNDAWKIVKEMNKPDESDCYTRYGDFIEELQKLIGSDLLFDALNTEKGNASYTISPDSLCISSLRACGVEIEA